MTSYFPFTIFQPNGRKTRGIPPVLVEKDAHCNDCGRVHDIEKCPLCGNWIQIGYGLAYGGCGLYKVCTDDACPWFYKVHDAPDESPLPNIRAVIRDPRWLKNGSAKGKS